MLYCRLIKAHLQATMKCANPTVEFIQDVQTISYDLCKSVTLDASLSKYKPSVLAACMIFQGF